MFWGAMSTNNNFCAAEKSYCACGYEWGKWLTLSLASDKFCSIDRLVSWTGTISPCSLDQSIKWRIGRDGSEIPCILCWPNILICPIGSGDKWATSSSRTGQPDRECICSSRDWISYFLQAVREIYGYPILCRFRTSPLLRGLRPPEILHMCKISGFRTSLAFMRIKLPSCNTIIPYLATFRRALWINRSSDA